MPPSSVGDNGPASPGIWTRYPYAADTASDRTAGVSDTYRWGLSVVQTAPLPAVASKRPGQSTVAPMLGLPSPHVISTSLRSRSSLTQRLPSPVETMSVTWLGRSTDALTVSSGAAPWNVRKSTRCAAAKVTHAPPSAKAMPYGPPGSFSYRCVATWPSGETASTTLSDPQPPSPPPYAHTWP